MNRKWGTMAGTLLITASLLAGGAAYAAERTEPAEKTDLKQKLQEKVEEGKLTAGEAEVVQKLHELRRGYHEKFRTDAQALIDQAVKEGKITKEQGERFKAPRKHGMPKTGPVMKEKSRDQDSKK
ncbi:MAG TPA: hypothetical protein VNT75_04160 [Symbiobacteriaceae bacterium]|nr:hypothetical protein [Symbiobacteriaceae bacterium]